MWSYLFLTLFTIAITPVYPSSVISEEAPWSNPAVWISAVIVVPKTFARIPTNNSGYLAPVHAFSPRLGNIHRALVESGLPFAVNAVTERLDK